MDFDDPSLDSSFGSAFDHAMQAGLTSYSDGDEYDDDLYFSADPLDDGTGDGPLQSDEEPAS